MLLYSDHLEEILQLLAITPLQRLGIFACLKAFHPFGALRNVIKYSLHPFIALTGFQCELANGLGSSELTGLRVLKVEGV